MTAITESRGIHRVDILKQIEFHELQIQELHARLPRAVKTFFRFRVTPGKYCWSYALTRTQAEKNVIDRMQRDYGPEGFTMLPVVDEFSDPVHAAGHSAGNLLRCLTEKEANEFITDWQADAPSRPVRPKDYPKSRVDSDIEDYLYALRQQGP
jgi:hypothetical protein